MDAHNAAVSRIATRVKTFYAAKQPFRLYHGTTNSTRTISRSAANTVDTSSLNHVLQVDTTSKTALCEPNVPMDVLLAATLQHNLIPLIVMELPSITVGGGFSGMAGESSSFRHGPFDSIVSSIEIVLPDGTITTASRTEQPDLFWGAACAFGTLGIVTMLEVQLRDAAAYVELSYLPAPDMSSATKILQEQTAKPEIDYVDAIAFSPTNIIICSGKLVPSLPAGTPSSSVRRYTRRTDPWYYLDVQKRTSKTTTMTKPTTDYVPVTDYFFRWDRGGFWVARYAFRYFFTPFNRVTRALLDRFMHAKVMYHALHKSGLSDQHVIQDVGVPYAHATVFREWLDREFNSIYPLWLCPIKIRRDDGMEVAGHGLHADFADPEKMPEPILLNFGVWGPAATEYDRFVRQNRDLEAKVHSLGGKKTLYAQNFYTREEFWDVYNWDRYDAVRRKYRADWMPDVWDKVGHVDEEARRRAMDGSRMPAFLRGKRPFQGLYGVYKAWRGGDYLLAGKKGEAKQNGAEVKKAE
ncbi:FAD binding domain protein [Microdochium trichocladiopsis]|uniref:Delta(24)-sterol reductase n=1 Tax=Microdochium trichocladiopsis TaxID=1682393 RepID=A0A9P8YK36_9PEZI|nr:FAD binding domain protein [Microdochium trichocladiopsis]KAH7041483.1 FAD binding domain protein [Microdochium trichocladiopsis]